ncbi:MAG: lytic transglycosylase domain-containing protein [Acidimicrobiales bacterium]|nr:lytic transglycosylase domain-containing protein [Acidimicrobiales bacterium]
MIRCRRPGRLGALALAAVVLAVACGNGGSNDANGTDGDDGPPTTSALSTSTSPPTTAAPTTATTAPVDVDALRPPAAAGDPAALATQIAEAEAVLRRPDASPADVATAALAQQVGYRQLGDHPAWDAAVFAALPTGLHPAAERHIAARRDLRALTGEPSDTMPAWRIVPPEPAADLVTWYREAEATFGVPWQYLAAINLVETATGRIRGTSVAGAQGPMQFMPATWESYGEGDVNDPRQAILAAGRYLAANGAPGDMATALWNYNHSDRYVRAVQAYADLIVEHPGAYGGFHGWGVWYWSTAGDIYLPVGWEALEQVPVEQYVAANPR